MTDGSIRGSEELGPVWSGTPAVRVDASSAHRASVVFGLPLYLLLIGALFGGLHALLRASGADGVPVVPTLVAGVVLLLVALGRGATMAVEIGDAGMWVRNRWRSVRLGWDEIEAVEVSTAVPYALVDIVHNTTVVADPYGEERHLVDPSASDVLAIRRRGRRRRLKAYASLGVTTDQEALQRLVAALAARGHHLDLAG